MSKKRTSIVGCDEAELVMTTVRSFQPHETEAILDYYRKYQVAHVKHCIDKEKFSFSCIQALFDAEPGLVQNSFTVETKRGESGHCQYNAADIYGKSSCPEGEWYTSFLAQCAGGESTLQSLDRFRTALPAVGLPLKASRGSRYAELLGVGSEGRGITHTDPIWVFVGRNCGKDRALHGRPEHVDSVEHDGTWHVQCRGAKVWLIRPAETAEWGGAAPSVAAADCGSGKRRRTDAAVSPEERALCADPACPRLRVVVEEGDLFLVNTRAWWHQTRIPPTGRRGLSISYARDFFAPALRKPARGAVQRPGSAAAGGQGGQEYTNVDGVYAARSVAAGDVVLTEDELPDCELGRSTEPTCEVVWLESGSGALVALRDLAVGDWLSVAPSDSESSGEDEEEEDEDEDCE